MQMLDLGIQHQHFNVSLLLPLLRLKDVVRIKINARPLVHLRVLLQPLRALQEVFLVVVVYGIELQLSKQLLVLELVQLVIGEVQVVVHRLLRLLKVPLHLFQHLFPAFLLELVLVQQELVHLARKLLLQNDLAAGVQPGSWGRYLHGVAVGGVLQLLLLKLRSVARRH